MGPRVIAAVVRRPSLWATAIVQAWRLAPRRWWRRWPFLPLPDRAYLRFRLETQYGGAGDHRAAPEDVVTWLQWSRAFAKSCRPRFGGPK